MAQSRPLFREGFYIREKHFALPEQTLQLDPRTKRDLTICNLFVNHHMSIHNIQHLLGEDARKIVHALIEHCIVEDRRQTNPDARWCQPQACSHGAGSGETPRESKTHT